MKKQPMQPTKIEWPSDWPEDEGWPTRDTGPVPGDRHGRTWADLDDALKQQGTSLAEQVSKMQRGKP